MITRAQVASLVEKLDKNLITLKEAKEYAKVFGSKAQGRTREQFSRALCRELAESERNHDVR